MKAYAIANATGSGPDIGLLERIGELVRNGIDVVQLRGKDLETLELYRLAERCRNVISLPARFLVNGRADVAIAAHADGVHLPANGMPVRLVRRLGKEMIVGRSCHSIDDCARAAGEGADYALLGPLFPPRSKQEGGRSLDVEVLVEAAGLGIPVYALGGFDRSRLALVSGLSIAGVAAITLFMQDGSIAETIDTIHAL